MTDLRGIVEELYATRLDAFVRTRNERARTARADGDRGLAATVAALSKPSVGAWVVNLLARERREVLTGLLDLGARMQRAQGGGQGDVLRSLAAEQSTMLDAVVDAGVEAAAAHEQAASDTVRARVAQTLRAAMADPAAAGAVLSCLLVRDLESPGFGPVDLDGALALPDEVAPYDADEAVHQPAAEPEPEPEPDPGRAEAVEEARTRLVEASRRAKESTAAREAAHDELVAIREHAEELRATEARLREELRSVKDEMISVQTDARAAERALRAAESESSEARFAERRRKAELDELSD